MISGGKGMGLSLSLFIFVALALTIYAILVSHLMDFTRPLKDRLTMEFSRRSTKLINLGRREFTLIH